MLVVLAVVLGAGRLHLVVDPVLHVVGLAHVLVERLGRLQLEAPLGRQRLQLLQAASSLTCSTIPLSNPSLA